MASGSGNGRNGSGKFARRRASASRFPIIEPRRRGQRFPYMAEREEPL
jgi:hypothetical protein